MEQNIKELIDFMLSICFFIGWWESVASIAANAGATYLANKNGGGSSTPSTGGGWTSILNNINWGDVIGSVSNAGIGLGADYLANKYIGVPNSELAYAYNAQAAREAHERSIDAYKNRYQWTMADMELAGLNPILAAGSGGFSVSGIPQMSSAQFPLPSSPYGAGGSSALSLAKTRTEKEVKKRTMKEIVRLDREVDLIVENTKKTKGETRQIGQNIKESKARINKMTKELLLINAQKEELQDRGMLEQQQQSYYSTLQRQVKDQIDKIRLETRNLRSMAIKLKKQGGVYEGSFGTILAYIEAIARVIGVPVSILGAAHIRTNK